MASQRVSYTQDGKVAVIRMDDGKANAISAELIDELDTMLERARNEARAVVLVGREGRFSGGFDLTVMMASPESARELVNTGAQFLMTLYLHPQPVVAACTGHALAAGALLLLASDVRIGSEGAFKIGLNEVAIGMRLPIFAIELARDRLAREHFVAASALGRVYNPTEAVDVGFLDRAVPADRCVQEAIATARKLADLPTGALAETKRLTRQPLVELVIDTLEEDLETVAPPRAAES
jgi:enoyl-CoA hydratase